MRPVGTESAQLPAFFREAVARIRALPGVSSARRARCRWRETNCAGSFEIEGQHSPMGSRPSADFDAVEPNYFHTIGTALITRRTHCAR